MLLTILVSISFASSWLVKAPEANPNEFFVYAQNSGGKKISQAFLRCPQATDLRQLLKEAQFNFLDGSLPSAQNKFSQIAEMKWNCDWNDDDRKAIVFSFVRLAQMSGTPAQQMNYLTEAIAFDDSIRPDKSVFPPPLLDLYNSTKEKMAKKHVLLPNFSKKYTALLKNGKFISLTNLTFETYPMRARLTFLSDTYKSETMTITPEELQNSELEPQALAEGSCDNPKASSELRAVGSYKVFFSPNCVVDSEVPTNQKQVLPAIPTLASSLPTTETKRKTWVERNWVWIGIAVAGVAVAAHQINQNNEPQTVVVPSNTFQQ